MLNWMAWTLPTASFFLTIAAILIVMTIIELRFPSAERKGFLPITTTRGDRLFIGLLTSAFFHLVFIGISDINMGWALALCIPWVVGLLRWG